MNKKHAIPGAVLALGVMAACGEDSGDGGDGSQSPQERTAVLKISEHDWNGWDEDYESEILVSTHEVKEGDTVSAQISFRGPFEITVDKIYDSSVALSFNLELAPPGENSGWEYNDLIDSLVVQQGETSGVATPSYDAGAIYNFEVEILN